MKIALRYYLTINPDEDFTAILFYLQATLNNSRNASTGAAPNGIVYGFPINDALRLLADLSPENFSQLRTIEAEESIA